MYYQRVCLMCPKCSHMQMFNANEEYSDICECCNAKMIEVERKYVSSEKEAHEEWLRNNTTIIKCPYCQSVNTKKITIGSKITHTALFGIFSISRNSHNYHCNNCGADF